MFKIVLCFWCWEKEEKDDGWSDTSSTFLPSKLFIDKKSKKNTY